MKYTTLLVAFLAAGVASAHPGHDAAVAQGVLHWLTEGSHLAVIGLFVLASAELILRGVRRVASRVRTMGRTDP